MNNACPCLSDKPYQDCCAPLHLGDIIAQSPEQLMRSRYSAFVKGDNDYIFITHSPKTRHNISLDSIKQWNEQCQWLGLNIVQFDKKRDIVEFVAWFKQQGQLRFHHEISTFKKEEIDPHLSTRLSDTTSSDQKTTSWYYFDATYPENTIKLPQRNDSCICGSKKKYKKCCGL